jgi:hypothetical protein
MTGRKRVPARRADRTGRARVDDPGLMSQLARLAELRRRGLLTDTEFDTAKTRLLDRGAQPNS